MCPSRMIQYLQYLLVDIWIYIWYLMSSMSSMSSIVDLLLDRLEIICGELDGFMAWKRQQLGTSVTSDTSGTWSITISIMARTRCITITQQNYHDSMKDLYSGPFERGSVLFRTRCVESLILTDRLFHYRIDENQWHKRVSTPSPPWLPDCTMFQWSCNFLNGLWPSNKYQRHVEMLMWFDQATGASKCVKYSKSGRFLHNVPNSGQPTMGTNGN